MENRNVFADNLQYYMSEKGVTRKDISDALGISYFTITSWVNGRKYPRMDKVEMLANYFGIQKSDLIEEQPEGRAIEKPITYTYDGLTENQKKLIDFARTVPEDKAAMILKVIQSIVEDA